MAQTEITKNESGIDELVYIVVCILSLGFWWVVRVVISKAIRRALK